MFEAENVHESERVHCDQARIYLKKSRTVPKQTVSFSTSNGIFHLSFPQVSSVLHDQKIIKEVTLRTQEKRSHYRKHQKPNFV